MTMYLSLLPWVFVVDGTASHGIFLFTLQYASINSCNSSMKSCYKTSDIHGLKYIPMLLQAFHKKKSNEVRSGDPQSHSVGSPHPKHLAINTTSNHSWIFFPQYGGDPSYCNHITPITQLGIHHQAVPARQFKEKQNSVEHPAGVVAGKGPRKCPPQNQSK
jgi:hypothetical protein